MLESIQRFLFGTRPDPDLNTVTYADKAPPVKAGLFRVRQRNVGDLWIDTLTMRLITYRWDGVQWERIVNDAVDVS